MHRVALIIVVVFGFLIAYQVVNPYRTQVCHFWENGDLCFAGCCVASGASKLDALYPSSLFG